MEKKEVTLSGMASDQSGIFACDRQVMLVQMKLKVIPPTFSKKHFPVYSHMAKAE